MIQKVKHNKTKTMKKIVFIYALILWGQSLYSQKPESAQQVLTVTK